MKKKPDSAPMTDEQVVAFLEEVLLEQGYMLPREPEHIAAEDLALYGRGTSRPVDVLRRSFEALKGAAPGVAARIGQDVNREVARIRRARLEDAKEARLARLVVAATSAFELSRSVMLEKLGEILNAFPQLQASHRDFEAMSDTDLRSLLEDFERLTNDDGR